MNADTTPESHLALPASDGRDQDYAELSDGELLDAVYELVSRWEKDLIPPKLVLVYLKDMLEDALTYKVELAADLKIERMGI